MVFKSRYHEKNVLQICTTKRMVFKNRHKHRLYHHCLVLIVALQLSSLTYNGDLCGARKFRCSSDGRWISVYFAVNNRRSISFQPREPDDHWCPGHWWGRIQLCGHVERSFTRQLPECTSPRFKWVTISGSELEVNDVIIKKQLLWCLRISWFPRLRYFGHCWKSSRLQ